MRNHLFAAITAAVLFLIGFSLPAGAKDNPLNINAAGAALLAERLPGIGPAKARAIVLYREEHGPFARVDDLENVRGIGPATIKRLRPLIQAGAAASGATLEENENAARAAVRAVVKLANSALNDEPEGGTSKNSEPGVRGNSGLGKLGTGRAVVD